MGEPLLHPPVEPLVEVDPVELDQAVVAEEVAARRHRLSLEDQQVVAVVEHPQPENGEGNPDLDGGVQASRDPVVEVPGDAGTQHATDRFTALKPI